VRLVHAVLARLGVCLVNERLLARLHAGVSAHDEQFDEMAVRLTNIESRVAEFDIDGKEIKAA
jgi:hypothetical protein